MQIHITICDKSNLSISYVPDAIELFTKILSLNPLSNAVGWYFWDEETEAQETG